MTRPPGVWSDRNHDVRPPPAPGLSRNGDEVDVEVREGVGSEAAEPRERSERQ
jgi:hypothetical protein